MGGCLLGAAVPELRQNHEARGSRTVASRPAAWEGNQDCPVLTGRRDRPRVGMAGPLLPRAEGAIGEEGKPHKP